MKSGPRPAVFIGSSAEGLGVAKAVQVNLDHTCDSVIWSQGVFGLNGGTLETLVNAAGDYDFAILALTPDDVVDSRDQSKPAPRDNVLFELGLFMGTLGRLRTFVIYDRTANLKLPSDLAGVTLADYQPHSSGNLAASLGAASTRIEKVIRELGFRKRNTLDTDVNQNTQFQIISDLLDPSASQFIILMHETGKMLRKETYLGLGYIYVYAFIKNRGSGGSGGFSVRTLCERLPDAGLLQVDLRDNVSLTPRGQDFAKWLTASGKKADYFQTEVGSWGLPSPEYEKWFNIEKQQRDAFVKQQYGVAIGAIPEMPKTEAEVPDTSQNNAPHSETNSAASKTQSEPKTKKKGR